MRIPTCREHEDRSARARANAAEHVESIQVRHHHVQHDERIRSGYRESNALIGIRSPVDCEAFRVQKPYDEGAQLGIVINDQDAIHNDAL